MEEINQCCKIIEVPYRAKREIYQTCKVCNTKKLVKEFYKIFKLKRVQLPYRSMCKACQEVWCLEKQPLYPVQQVVDEHFVVVLD